MAKQKRTAFFVSDSTAITSETLGHTLLTQFESAIEVEQHSMRFVDNVERAQQVRKRINEAAIKDGAKPLVFSTSIDPDVRAILKSSNCVYMDFFDAFIETLEREICVKSSLTAGRSHGLTDIKEYSLRIEAVNFTLNHDDGSTISHLEDADIILVGISRTGKTPTCLYMSLHYGIRAANFPLTEDELEDLHLPKSLIPHRAKLFGLTIDPQRLHQIRQERLPNSRYASLEQCDFETRQAETLFRKLGIPFLRSTLKSIEEIATTIIDMANLEKRRPPPANAPLHT